MTDEVDDYFCEYDTETILDGDGEGNGDETSLDLEGGEDQSENRPEDQPHDPGRRMEEEDVIYRLRRMLTEKDDEDYKFHEQSFKKSCTEILDIALSKTANEKSDRLNEAGYLSICTNLKRAFDSHKSMVDFLVRINNELKDDLNWYKRLLGESQELNRKISEEIADIKRDLNLDISTVTVSFYDEVD